MAQIALAMVFAESLERIMKAQPQRLLEGTGCVRPRGTQYVPGTSFELHVRWCLYVDDIAVHFMGSQTAVAKAINETTAVVIEGLEEGLRMEVSRRQQWSSSGKGKTVLAISGPVVPAATSFSMRRLGIKVQLKHLMWASTSSQAPKRNRAACQ